ncbi:calponin domain containing protein [Acanthamoeba castellanii str. Neff]|uniref:Calponin domain containing protein n=1 Tax=Acanthamoeba castellanii (strain ATCC 30010 / Neff) TaxID=1257118 RepID=L8HD83_ACACF|nr:calponin domain containing protein [Acanthamoeba castellanii str. Neff]ELR22356.1 calponin domain containing protein [Acanthamoeba castellanii str. Neff]
MSEISSRLQEDKKEKKENKKKNNSKGATATREGRSATTLEAPGPSKLNSSKSRSSSVRNALTCFIPSSKESTAMDETMIDKKKMGDMITLAAEAEDDDGGSGKRKKKKAGKSGSTSSSSSSSSSLSLPASPTRAPTVHHHRLSGGMAFGDDQRGRGAAAKKHRRNLSALEDLQYNNVVVVATNNGTAAPMAIPTSSSSPALDARPSKKNTLSPHMRSSSDRFSYNSKHNKEKLKTTKGGGRPNERNSNELADRRSSGLAKESRTGNRHRSSSSSSASSSSSSSSSGDEGSGHKKKNKKKEKKNKKKDKQRQQQQQQQLGSPNSKVMTASMSWRAKKTSQSGSATPAPGPGTQIIISPRKPAPAFPKSKQRLSFSGWLTHFNVQLNPGAAENGPKRKYKEGTVEGFLEDIQLDEHVNELVKVRGIASMERLFEVTTQQFYDMDIPTSDLRLLIEEIGKRKNPPAVESPTPQGDKPATPRQKTPRAHNNSAAQPDATAAGGEEVAATETKRKRRSTRSEKRRLEKEADDAAVLQALEQRLGEEADRRARAEQERDEALRALEAERQRAGDVERKLAEALARIQALEQSLAAAQATTAESTKKKTKAPKKTKAKAKAKKEKERDAATEDAARSRRRRWCQARRGVAKGEHDDVSKAKEATATTSAPGETAEKAHGDGDRDAPETPAEGDGEGEGEGLIQYHYPLPIRVPSGRVNRLSTRLSLKAKSPASPRGASPRTVVNTNSSEGRMRQAEKETFEQKQNDIRHWIEEATKESFPSADFFKSLRSGVLLCKLLNVISPGIVKEVHVGDMVFYQMENITYFVQGCRKLGVKTVFEPADLYHGKNLEAVLSCLDALDRWSRRSTTYKGPFLVRSTSHSQFIRSLSGKLMLDKDVITAKKDSSSEIRPPTRVVAAANPN